METVGQGESHHLEHQRPLPPQLGHRRLGKGGHLAAELVHILDFPGETARHTDALLGLDVILKTDARLPAQLLPRAPAGQCEVLPDIVFLELRIVPRRSDVHQDQLFRRTAPDAPHVFRRETAEHLLDVLRPVHIAATLQLGILFAELRRDLGQRFSGGNAHGYGDARHFLAGPRNLPRVRSHIRPLHTPQVQERLVDGILLDRRGEHPQHLLHPTRHIAVQREIRRKHRHVVLLHDVTDFEKRSAHRDAQCLGLVAAGDGTAIVVAQHDDGLSLQIGTEHPFARSEEIVAVGQGEHRTRPS